MGPGGATRFGDVRRYGEVDSTNRVVADLARDGAPEGVVVVADHQTAGRGRWGRRWEAPPGSSLLVSVLLRPALKPAELPLVTLATGVAAAEACREVAGVTVGLKWPNDLVVDDTKVGGILTELVAEEASLAVVVGLGVNVAWREPLPAGATDLGRLAAQPVDRNGLLDGFLIRLDTVAGWLETAAGRERLLDRYRACSVTLGRTVTVSTPADDVTGLAVAIGADGHLVVETADGTRHEIFAGMVTHVRQH